MKRAVKKRLNLQQANEVYGRVYDSILRSFDGPDYYKAVGKTWDGIILLETIVSIDTGKEENESFVVHFAYDEEAGLFVEAIYYK
jgi:hypothetical protein